MTFVSVECSLETTFGILAEGVDILQGKLKPYIAPNTTPHLLLYQRGARGHHQRALLDAAGVLQVQLNRVNELLDTLGSIRNTLHQRYAAVHNALAPVGALPVEVIGDIFNHVFADGKANDRALYATRALSQVCSHWRTIALCTPHLWADIDVTACSKFPSSLIEASLARSFSVPRRLLINAFGVRPQTPTLSQTVCDTLSNLSISSDDPHTAVFPALNHTFPKLKLLTICNYPFSEQPTVDFAHANGFSAPMLSTLKLKDLDLLNLSFVGATITSLHLFSASLDHAWHRIGLDCPQLERLAIRDCEWHEALPVIVIPKLEFLEINIDAGCDDEKAIPVQADCLRHLRLSGTSVLTNVQPMLFEYSSRAPDLQTFETLNVCGIEDIFKEVAADPQLFPDLRQVAIYTPWDSSRESVHEPHELAAMIKVLVESRARGAVPIEKVVATRSILDSDREWFGKHVKYVIAQEYPVKEWVETWIDT